MKWKILIQWMTSSYMLGCLAKSIMLWFVFFSWSKCAHLHLLHPCEAEPSMPGLAFCTGTTYSSTQKQSPTTAVSNCSTCAHYWEHLEGWQSAWHAGSFIDKFLCGDKAPVLGHRTDAPKPTHLHTNNTFLIISSFMLNMDIDMLPCLPKVVLIYIYGT